MMKLALAVLLLVVFVESANAVVYCRAGYYGAGCVARPGVVVAPRVVPRAVVRPGVYRRPVARGHYYRR